MKKRRPIARKSYDKVVGTGVVPIPAGEPFDDIITRFDVPSDATMEQRILRFQNFVMTASERGYRIPHFMDIARQINLVLRCEYTLKGIRKEGGDGRADTGSAVRQYAAEFDAPQAGFSPRGEGQPGDYGSDATDTGDDEPADDDAGGPEE